MPSVQYKVLRHEQNITVHYLFMDEYKSVVNNIMNLLDLIKTDTTCRSLISNI